MDYEKKYNEALDRAKKLSVDGYLDAIAVEEIFPELREPEDERVIRTLYYLVKDHNWLNGATKGEVLAWLEKLKVMTENGYGTYYYYDGGFIFLASPVEEETYKEPLHVAETCKENVDSFINEDERIRKWLIDYFSSIKETVWIHRDITCKQILAYLEKQKEPSWKPGEEQMKALEIAFRKDGDDKYRSTINSLYNDLKKL